MIASAAKWLLVLALALAVSGCADAQPRETALRLEFEAGVCSATAVGPNVILAATHCWADGPLLKINGVAASALEIETDKSDHALVRVDVTFTHWAQLGPPPQQADRIRFWK